MIISCFYLPHLQTIILWQKSTFGRCFELWQLIIEGKKLCDYVKDNISAVAKGKKNGFSISALTISKSLASLFPFQSDMKHLFYILRVRTAGSTSPSICYLCRPGSRTRCLWSKNPLENSYPHPTYCSFETLFIHSQWPCTVLFPIRLSVHDGAEWDIHLRAISNHS